MTVTDTRKDTDALILAITAEYDAPPDRVWELWADPRKLERWWGPPGWPATFTVHEFWPGGMAGYYMTGPDGVQYPGWWRFVSMQAPRVLTFVDGFSDASGTPDTTMPETTTIVSLYPLDGGRTRMVVESKWATLESMEKLVAMGMVEGMTMALSQTDAILAGTSSGASG
jgi:uncharacterized protein YndB with AHSA1/START domain